MSTGLSVQAVLMALLSEGLCKLNHDALSGDSIRCLVVTNDIPNAFTTS